MDPAITVVIPMLNAKHKLAKLLMSLMDQDFARPWEIIAVDNGSDDGTAQLARELLDAHPPSNLIRREVIVVSSPRGYATPRNAGARHSRAPLLAFCDTDGAVGRGWLSAMTGALSAHPLVASRKFYVADVSKRHFTDSNNDVPRLPSIRGVDFVTSAGMGCTAELFESLEGFDPHFDTGGEDPDFSFRARSRYGIEPFLAEEAHYWSGYPQSLKVRFTKGLRDGRSEVRLYVRHHESLLRDSSGPMTALRDLGRLSWSAVSYPWSRRRSTSISRDAGYTIGRAVWSVRLGVCCF